MSKKTRYLLLLLCLVIFLIIAPALVLYSTGLQFNFQTGQFVKTGVLAIRSDPASVNVVLNGKTVRSSDGDIKFLLPGEYNLSLQKAGYQTWSKRFFVQADQVTWANPAPNNLTLFKNNAAPATIANNVTDMALEGSNIYYLSASGLTASDINNPSKHQTYTLNNPVTNIMSSPNGKNFLLGNFDQTGLATSSASYFDGNGQKIISLNKLIQGPAIFSFSDDNNLYALQNNSLYKLDVSNQTKTSVVSNVAAFSVASSNIYYLQKSATGSALMVLPSGGQPQTLLSNLPGFNSGQIFVNFQKQIILLLDGTLYQAGSVAIPLVNNVSDVNFNQSNSELLVLHSGELDSYNYSDQGLDFITRTGLPLKNFIIRSDLGYAFFFKDNSLEALELDLRDIQNEYAFYQAAQPQKFILDGDGKNLYILDGGKLLKQTIR